MVAYLDKDSWEIADKIVEKMDQGRIHGKRIPTTFTFRFLHGCKSAAEKKERLLAYLHQNSTDGYKLAKKRSVHPQVGNWAANYRFNGAPFQGLNKNVNKTIIFASF